jgi:integrase
MTCRLKELKRRAPLNDSQSRTQVRPDEPAEITGLQGFNATLHVNCDSLPSRGQQVDERGGCLARRRYQKGSVFLKRKTWMGRWWDDVIDSDGTVRRIRRARAIGTVADLPTKKLALRRLELYLAKVNAPGYRPGRVATLAEFVERWRVEVLVQHKPSTMRAAESHLRTHIIPTLGACRLEVITPELQQTFVASLSKKLRRKTVLNVLATLSAILNTAKRWGYICEGVDFERLTFPAAGERSRARFFTVNQARRIIAGAKEPFTTIFALAAMTAMRPGELLGLKVEDLDFERGIIFVRRSAWYSTLQSPKNEGSVRVLPMPKPLAVRLKAHVQRWCPQPPGLLFATRKGTPLCANNVVQRNLWPILDKLRIARCGLKAFRHTHATLLVDGGAPVTVAQAQLGHADSRTTLGVYAHAIAESHRRAVEKLARVLDSSGLPRRSISKWVQ